MVSLVVLYSSLAVDLNGSWNGKDGIAVACGCHRPAKGVVMLMPALVVVVMLVVTTLEIDLP